MDCGHDVGMARRISSAVLCAALLTGACTASPADRGPEAEAPPVEPTPTALAVDELADGLEHGWDVGFLPGGKLLLTERPGKLKLFSSGKPGAEITDVDANFDDVFAEGEGGLMGLAVHPDFEQSQRFTTCQTHQADGEGVDVRLVTWRLASDGGSARRVNTLLTGMPINGDGRHSGCRPMFDEDGALLVGTGDAADPATAQDKAGLGGKVLRIDPETGEGLDDNPFADSDNPNTRRIASFGHRNIQGITMQPGSARVFTAEHGPDVDDEVNVLELGGNYGWDPSQGGTVDSYDESVPMTDLDRFPDAVRPAWTTGDMTEAICGTDFLTGDQWGELEGSLAVASLRGSKLILLGVDDNGEITKRSDPAELDGEYGRLRAARTGPDGALYVTTSNGDNDLLLRVTPAP